MDGGIFWVVGGWAEIFHSWVGVGVGIFWVSGGILRVNEGG